MTAIWIIVLVAILAFGQTLYYNKKGLSKVHYTRHFNKERVFAGENVELVEELTNDKLIPVPWVRVESRISSNLRFRRQENMGLSMDLFHKSLFYLGGYAKITRRHYIECLSRGYYDCSLVSIVGGDLLGLAHDRRDMEGDAKLYVYPPILNREEMPENALKWQGDVTVRRWILPDPILVTGIREYRSGDPQKDVHWGATARTGQLQVKQRDFTVSPRALIILNCQCSESLFGLMEPEQQAVIEHGINLAATLASWCVRSGIDVGFLSNGENKLRPDEPIAIEPRCSDAQLELILETMALLNIKMKLDLHTLLDRQIEAAISDMDILIVSAYWNEDLEYRAARLRKLGNSVTRLPIREGG